MDPSLSDPVDKKEMKKTQSFEGTKKLKRDKKTKQEDLWSVF